MHSVAALIAVLLLLAALATWLVQQSKRQDEIASWPVTEATIQSIGKVVVNAGKSSYSVDICDFSYVVNDEYYSGRLKISRSFSTGDRELRELVNQKVQAHYNPQKPEDHSVDQQEVMGFLLDSWDENLGTDVDPIDLHINSI